MKDLQYSGETGPLEVEVMACIFLKYSYAKSFRLKRGRPLLVKTVREPESFFWNSYAYSKKKKHIVMTASCM
jgi:hypothetical protein